MPRLSLCWQLLLIVLFSTLTGVATAQPDEPEGAAAPTADGDTPTPPSADAPKPPAAPAPPTASDVDDEGPPPVSEADKKKAKRHFIRGIQLLKEEAWAPALAEFLLSRALFPTRAGTKNAAVALRQLQRYDEAIDMWETLLRDFKVPPDEEEEAQKQITELRSLVGTIDISGAEPGASIVVSSEDRGEFPPVKPVRVPAGNHVVRIYKEGFEPFETRVDVAGGQIVSIQAKMARLSDSGKLRVTERTGRTLDVVVDNVVVGQTPWEGTLGVGPHVVALRGEGKLGTQPAAATVKSQETTNLTLVAEDLDSQLRVDPTPPGATVSINGVDVGNGVWLGRLKSGQHKIEARADGFLNASTTVTLTKGQRETLPIELERDDDAPIWRKPSRWVLDGSAAFLLVPSFGGDVAESCGADCSAAPGVGLQALVSAAYELGNGVGFGIEAGYVLASQSVERRDAALNPRGLSPNTGFASDNLRMQGVMAGAHLGYHFGEEYPVLLRIGGGVLYGELRDERSGSYTDSQMDQYQADPISHFPTITYFYVDPTVRAGVRFGDNWELSGSVQALMLIALDQPRFDSSLEVRAENDGLGSYSDETLMGSFVIGVAPGANLRYDFQ